MSQTERLRIAISVARKIRDAIDQVNGGEFGVICAYPDCITVDSQTFVWDQLITG